ncbi:hypothetical protein NDU88_007192 [Pleurodeles waltl]|uniref:Uncharacterized protein n=1 Tax=Pleurodeles waltl TaxID=8319 RepID=A0AAV7UPS1_PLEWA|nr:hypothetical protein NDU88_007192 [Pleurodeles waltl]
MSERLNKQVKRVDEAEGTILVVEDDYNEMSRAQTKINKTVAALWAKVEDLKAPSCRSNIQVVDIAESAAIDNTVLFVE